MTTLKLAKYSSNMINQSLKGLFHIIIVILAHLINYVSLLPMLHTYLELIFIMRFNIDPNTELKNLVILT